MPAPAREELVEDHSHREHIAAPVEDAAADVLGAHVCRRPE